MTDDGHSHRPARREPMLWLVFGLPALVVVASLVTVWISARGGANDPVFLQTFPEPEHWREYADAFA